MRICVSDWAGKNLRHEQQVIHAWQVSAMSTLVLEVPLSPAARETRPALSRRARDTAATAAAEERTPLAAAVAAGDTSSEAQGASDSTAGGAALGAKTPFLTPTPALTRHTRLYLVFISALGSAIIAAAINFGIQTAVFDNDKATNLFLLSSDSNSIAGAAALTIIIQTVLTTVIGGTVMFEDVWAWRVAPLQMRAAPSWARPLLAATSTVIVRSDALTRETGCFIAAGRRPQPLGTVAEVRPPTPALSLAHAGGCCTSCTAFFGGIISWSIAIPDPLHARELTEVATSAARTRSGMSPWAAIGGLVARGFFFSVPAFIVVWPVWIGITAAIWGSDNDTPPRGVYNRFPQPTLILTVMGFVLALIFTPLLSLAVLFRAGRYAIGEQAAQSRDSSVQRRPPLEDMR